MRYYAIYILLTYKTAISAKRVTQKIIIKETVRIFLKFYTAFFSKTPI